MKLWRIWQEVNNNYDTYDSAVVAAETEDEARHTHPGNYNNFEPGGTWAPVDHVRAELIGTAKPGTKAGVIVASFNAG